MLPAVSDYDVIVVGAGNAALAAAVSAREQGAVAAGGQRPSLAHYVTGMGHPWTERPLPEVFVLPILQTLSTTISFPSPGCSRVEGARRGGSGLRGVGMGPTG
jgi:hypothetical protein